MSENNLYPHTIPAVDRTLTILERLGMAPDGAAAADLYDPGEITNSTAYRIFQTLMKHRWIVRRADGKFDFGGGALPLRLKLQPQYLLDHAQSVLDRLAQETGFACKLSVRIGDEQSTVLRADPPGPFGVSGRVGSRFPVIEGATGAALLAAADRSELEHLVRACRTEIEEKRDPELLFRAVEAVRNSGAVRNTHTRWGIVALAAPVPDAAGYPLAALTLLSLPGTLEDFGEEKAVKLLKSAARRCSPPELIDNNQRS